jgi:L-alanine-DL-glutamate epimerase-like enolase superfamily enzyme
MLAMHTQFPASEHDPQSSMLIHNRSVPQLMPAKRAARHARTRTAGPPHRAAAPGMPRRRPALGLGQPARCGYSRAYAGRQPGYVKYPVRRAVKITAIRLDRLRLPLDPPFRAAWDPVPRRHFDATLVRVQTDEGITGYGSGDTMDGFAAYQDLFLGRDPRQIARHVRVIETISFHASRYWPLEAALWDIIGKASGQPVSALFGGALRRIPAYASFGEARSPGERADAAVAAKEAGFRAVKIRIGREDTAAGLAAVRAAREAVGADLAIMVDLNQCWRMAGDISAALDLAAVRRLAVELAELDVLWLEEPLPGADLAGLRALRERAGIRVAGGEMARTPAELLDALAADALDVLQPDVVLSVGLLRARTVAEIAMLRNRWFTPHTWTNGLGLLANLHVAAGVGGGPYLEFPYDPPGWTVQRRDFFLAAPVRVDAGGYLNVPDAPGLGAKIDEDAVARWALPLT